MFTLNTIEAQTGVVEMPDTTYEAVKAFVEFIYLGSAEHFESLADQLYILADKYDVPPLKVVFLNGEILLYFLELLC
jgi:hypothetical protein